MRSKDIISVCAIVAMSIFFLFVAIKALESDPIYVTGTVIATDQSQHMIEVKLGDRGPRVYVRDLGCYKMADVKFDDKVTLQFYKKKYKLTHIQNSE